ncbi:MAG: cupin domain-containing protein [Anaerolineae bacterium]|nr:cupin domain-containing protein [Anaerolineae bacterium]NIN96777.1 cupin domain-containing protein [Anaerolineae bacterium]NIQ79773.1 cupin domain-containing protein [Anaerolineae bacterium]
MVSADEIIERLGMQPHPEEGGYFVQTYKSEELISKLALPDRYPSPRAFGTAIFYLLTPDTFSALHRLASDEIFHFYLGDPVTMLQLHLDGSSQVATLGQDILAGQELQVVVPRGTWQGSLLNEGGEFALLGCTVSPGFEYEDYEAGSREEFLVQYPAHRELILRLTAAT